MTAGSPRNVVVSCPGPSRMVSGILTILLLAMCPGLGGLAEAAEAGAGQVGQFPAMPTPASFMQCVPKAAGELGALKASAERGDPVAQCTLGAMYRWGDGAPQDDVQAARWFRKAAEQGLAEAQSKLGLMYVRGQGVPKDYDQAVQWIRKAAEQGYAEAQNNLGVRYENGQGVPRDDALAVQWYRKAAAQGLADAQNNLGRVYASGQGVPRDYVESHMWFDLASAFASEERQKEYAASRDRMAKNLNAAQIADARKRAREWMAAFAGPGDTAAAQQPQAGPQKPPLTPEALKELRQRAEQGDAKAAYDVGEVYVGGQGVPEDDAEAVRWFRKAADKGSAPAQWRLGAAYSDGWGVRQDRAEAVKWFRSAAEQGGPEFAFQLANLYLTGEVVPYDAAESTRWLRRSADQNYAAAQCLLGLRYAGSRPGETHDDVEAYKWFDLGNARAPDEIRKECTQWRDELAGKMTPAQIAEAKKRAREWTESFEQRKK